MQTTDKRNNTVFFFFRPFCAHYVMMPSTTTTNDEWESILFSEATSWPQTTCSLCLPENAMTGARHYVTSQRWHVILGLMYSWCIHELKHMLKRPRGVTRILLCSLSWELQELELPCTTRGLAKTISAIVMIGITLNTLRLESMFLFVTKMF